jgi:hypothetical protein
MPALTYRVPVAGGKGDGKRSENTSYWLPKSETRNPKPETNLKGGNGAKSETSTTAGRFEP